MSLLPPPWAFTPPTFDPTPLPLGERGLPAPPPFAAARRASPFDAVSRPWFAADPFGTASPFGGLPGTTIYGLIRGLIAQLQDLAAKMLGETKREGGPQQRALDVTLSSSGDPHLSESGTVAGATGTQTIDARFDSMISHDDLLHAGGVAGGYRVSSRVSAPDANGVTTNASATVHANFDQDRITLDGGGTLSVQSAGQPVTVAPGQTLTLAGGETITRNADGSAAVSGSDGAGGTIVTTLLAGDGRVDVSAHALDIAIGGDIVTRRA